MVVESFTLTELLLTRQWLIMIDGLIKVPWMTKEQLVKVSDRIREIDEEVTARVIDGKKPNVINFVDPDFTETVKEEFGRGIEPEDPDAGA